MRELLSNESIIDWLRDHDKDLPQTVVRELQKLDLRGQWYSEKEYRIACLDSDKWHENYCNASQHIEELDSFIERIINDEDIVPRVKIRKKLDSEFKMLIENTYHER